MSAPAFLVTIDVEGDNLWAKPRRASTQNARFLPRFHELCVAHGIRPTYLVDYEMARDAAFVEFGREVVRAGTGEIGTHLHAWNTPPLVPLTRDDLSCQPYLMEYPFQIMADKIAVLTDLLEQAFGVRMRSHRAGRWGFNEAYARALVARGYETDCSVTPHLSWRLHRGDPDGAGGPDYRRFPDDAYFVDLDDISRAGESALLEVPVTVVRRRPAGKRPLEALVARAQLAGRVIERVWPSVHWLRPNGRNGNVLVDIVLEAEAAGRSYVEFMLHSSELMPGGSARFPDRSSIERLYRDLEALFAAAGARCRPATLAEFYTYATVASGRPRLSPPVAVP